MTTPCQTSGFYFSVIGTTEEANAQRLKAVARNRTILMDLLPSDGSPMTIRRLANVAYMPDSAVTEALFDEYMEGRIGFDVRADTFWRLETAPQGEGGL